MIKDRFDLNELSRYKHLDEISEKDQNLAIWLAEELKTVLEKSILLDPCAAESPIKTAKFLRKQIKEIGFLTRAAYTLRQPSFNDPFRAEVDVELLVLKRELIN